MTIINPPRQQIISTARKYRSNPQGVSAVSNAGSDYLRPNGVDTYNRPDGTSLYKRP